MFSVKCVNVFLLLIMLPMTGPRPTPSVTGNISTKYHSGGYLAWYHDFKIILILTIRGHQPSAYESTTYQRPKERPLRWISCLSVATNQWQHQRSVLLLSRCQSEEFWLCPKQVISTFWLEPMLCSIYFEIC